MCCGHSRHHGGGFCGCGERHHRGHHGRGSWGCGGPARRGRHFWTKEEKIAWLEQYLEDLQQETKAVKEHIAEMKGEA